MMKTLRNSVECEIQEESMRRQKGKFLSQKDKGDLFVSSVRSRDSLDYWDYRIAIFQINKEVLAGLRIDLEKSSQNSGALL